MCWHLLQDNMGLHRDIWIMGVTAGSLTARSEWSLRLWLFNFSSWIWNSQDTPDDEDARWNDEDTNLNLEDGVSVLAAHISRLTQVSMPTHTHTHLHRQTKMSGEVIHRQITTRSKYYLYLDIYLSSTFRRRSRASSVFLASLLKAVKQEKRNKEAK